MKKILKILAFIILIGIGIYLSNQNENKKVACNYSYQEAQYFLASTTNFLLIDQGTAPDPRIFIVYDLNKCVKTYEGKYSKPFEMKGETMTYWEPIDEKVTAENCPKQKEHQGYGLGAGIESRTTLDLVSLNKKSLNENRCSARQ